MTLTWVCERTIDGSLCPDYAFTSSALVQTIPANTLTAFTSYSFFVTASKTVQGITNSQTASVVVSVSADSVSQLSVLYPAILATQAALLSQEYYFVISVSVASNRLRRVLVNRQLGAVST